MSAEHEHRDDKHHDHDSHDHDSHDHDGHDHDCGCHTPPPGCEDCDPDLIDDLACQAEGIAAQAAYNAQSQPELQQAGTDYATARSAYRAARTAATLEVQDLRHQTKQLIERIRCQIKQDDVADCLDRAYRHIRCQLDECGTGGECCAAEDCDVDKTCPEDYDELAGRIGEYEGRLLREKECFATLIAEPEALTARVAAVKAEIDAINADLGADPATVDIKKVYVSALVAQRHLDQVWNGFAQTKDYMDCLCRALTCWTKLSDAVSVLTGCKAVKDCHLQARRKRCEDLAAKTVEEVLLEYERLCGNDSCDDDTQDDDSDDHDHDHDHDDDCGCDHGHEHRRSHHHHSHHHKGGAD